MSEGGAARAAGLERLREKRVKPSRDLTVRAVLDGELRRVRQVERSARSAAGAWGQLLETAGLSAELVERTKVVSFRFGVLTVRVSDAPTKYAVDRFLRGGGEAALARLAAATLRRVKLVM
jgi:hypothetical protein